MSRRPSGARFGYEPALDGLRAIAVIAVVLYHVHSLAPARFGFAKGGFFGVELFFVVSGYLITTLLAEEVRETGTVDLRQFWLRRARRLLPALFALLVAIGISAVLWAPHTLGRFRRDLPWAVFYVSNWGQIFDSASGYFAQLGTAPLVRHLWSLAVEEQWYLIWPLVFTWLVRRRIPRLGVVLLGAGFVTAASGMVLYNGSEGRTNLVYLATFTRASGLLIGAALAMVWRPWRSAEARGRTLPLLDAVVVAGLAIFLFAVVMWSNQSTVVYRGGMLLVSLVSALLIAMVMHPGAARARNLLGAPPIAGIGRRSYGLYLWHWPILVLTDATRSTGRLLAVFVLVAGVTEASYRFIEQPFRRGLLGRWLADRDRPTFDRVGYSIAALAVLVPLGIALGRAKNSDILVGGDKVAFELPATSTAPTADTAVGGAVAGVSTTTAVPGSTTVPGPVSLVLVGDSQAHSLAANPPVGLETVFAVSDGSVDGCGVWDDGTIWSRLDGYKRSNTGCAGWPAKWAASASSAKADVALVMLGAWDVFDVAYKEGVTAFNTAQWDVKFTANLAKGIEALTGAGTKVALLEVPCMNPIAAKGATVPPLPERGEPWRTSHVNELLRRIAAADPTHVSFIAGPPEWCGDPAVATNVNFRWDGVHVYTSGAKLIYERIAPDLLKLAGR